MTFGSVDVHHLIPLRWDLSFLLGTLCVPPQGLLTRLWPDSGLDTSQWSSPKITSSKRCAFQQRFNSEFWFPPKWIPNELWAHHMTGVLWHLMKPQKNDAAHIYKSCCVQSHMSAVITLLLLFEFASFYFYTHNIANIFVIIANRVRFSTFFCPTVELCFVKHWTSLMTESK